jgi:1-deoxy-D-xylulose-5-phosphate synthase
MSDRMWKYISRIENPADLKKLDINALKDVCQEIREYLIDTISKTGGHLGASLGAVELSVALHYVFNAPIDKIIWDVGHQAYPHKILTGRRDQLPTIRHLGGISGFTKMTESEYDPFGAGHASTSISAALGIACARDYNNDNYKVIAVIGDGSMTGGLAYEGMNNCGLFKKDIIVVLNDNNMSISPNVWAISNYFNELISGSSYNKLKSSIWNVANKYFSKGDRIAHLANKIQSGLKSIITPGILFEALGFRYFGPFNGHNIIQLVKIFNKIRSFKTPILIHVITEKGKGYAPAENDFTKFHGVTPFDKQTGASPKPSSKSLTYTDVFGESLVQLAEKDSKVLAITAAMSDGTGLNKFKDTFPDRFFDVGIAEGHAVTFAAGLAAKGYKPIVAIYSTFLQRAFDQIIHDVALQDLPVIFVMDRGGFVGADGPTHHGTFDLSYLRLIPNMVIAASMDENELRDLLYTAITYGKGPFAIRYPKGKCLGLPTEDSFNKLEVGKGQTIKEGKDIAILAIGSMINQALKASLKLENENISAEVINMRFIKPIDQELLLNTSKRFKKIITIEENAIIGGFGSAVIETLTNNGISDLKIFTKGIPDKFIEHGTVDELYKTVGLDVESIYNFVKGIVVDDQ